MSTSAGVWFELDDDDLDGNEAAAGIRAFAETLRRRAMSWPMDPLDTLIYAGDAKLPTIAYLDLSTTERDGVLLTVGVHLLGDRIRADELHNQSFLLPARPTPLSMEATGEPAELGERAADWFEDIIRRPIQRREWIRDGQLYAFCEHFVDGYPLRVSGPSTPGAPDRVIELPTYQLV
jgi:hypothetical protein